ncbi:MAG TPA: hypothetical protein VGE22_11045 [Solimonas sp.]
MSKSLLERFIAWAKRTPYFHLEGYMLRYWTRQPKPGRYITSRLHHILREDTDRAHHDHPWGFVSLVLRGWYIERRPRRQNQHPALDDTEYVDTLRRPGSLMFRRATDRHKIIEVAPNGAVTHCWFFGRDRRWGFHDPVRGWVWWRDYLDDYTTKTAEEEP